MSALTSMIDALAVDSEPATAPTLLSALARAPAAAALVVAALGEADRRALRLAHSELRDAVGEATTKLEAVIHGAAAARPPLARRWPRLRELVICDPDLAALEALGAQTWESLRSLCVTALVRIVLDVPAARALAAVLRNTPALRSLELRNVSISDASAEELFCSSVEAVPPLRSFACMGANFSSAAASALAATEWELEELNLSFNFDLGAGLAALLAAPTFALRRLSLASCCLTATALLAVVNAPWPLEELDLSGNDFSALTAGPGLAALAQRARLRKLCVGDCNLDAAGFRALQDATWPSAVVLGADGLPVRLIELCVGDGSLSAVARRWSRPPGGASGSEGVDASDRQ